jgi:hypothetical protein
MNLNLGYNIHNSMLEGYGTFNTSASNKANEIAPIRNHDQLNNFICLFNTTFSYSTKNITVFYTFYSKLKEVKSTGIVAYEHGHEADKNPDFALEIPKWFQYARIGVVLHGF